MHELQEYLDVAGFQPRRAQTDLFNHLIGATNQGVVAQAGTGTGKSAAVLAAAAHQSRVYGTQSTIVTPTLTLMNQYLNGDVPIAREAYPDLLIAELRGRIHYHCDLSRDNDEVIGLEYRGGCQGGDGGCTANNWSEMETREPDNPVYRCDYQAAKFEARLAQVVVTNADMLIVNDRILAPLGLEIFELDGSLFVDEAHTLEQKLRDWASRSIWWKNLERFNFAGVHGPRLGDWLKERAPEGQRLKELPTAQMVALRAIAGAHIPPPTPKDGLARQRETKEACMKILKYLEDPHDSAVLHVHDGSLKTDWINVSQSAGELLRQRRFGLVSATVPKTMAATLGVQDAPFIDVGHPFDYKKAWLGFSAYGGDYKSAQHQSNFDQRVGEVRDLLLRSKGGALVLFSSFRDLERVVEVLTPVLYREGIKILVQERGMEAADRQRLADEFKADGNAVLFGSESFATGFDVPGPALRLVVIWKLPYPAVDPVSRAIRSSSYQRYEDLMKVRAIQAMGRLIRTAADSGVVFWADNRARRLIDAGDSLTSHVPEFSRLP